MANKMKQVDGYQVKQVLADKSGELNAFGWNKVKNSNRTIKKKAYVNVRRKIALSKIPGLKPLEGKYEKWSKKKIKKNPIGGIFAFLFMIVFFAVALVGLYIGLNDNLIGGNAYEKSIAVYNAAVATNMITADADDVDVEKLDLCTYDAESEAIEVTDGYKAFVKKYVAYSFAGFINNYTYGEDGEKLDAEADAAKINAFAKEYLKQIEQLQLLGEEEEAVAYDSSLVYNEEENSYSAKAGLLGPVDGLIDGVVRPLLQGFVDYKPIVMFIGIPLLAGAVCLILFVICLISFIRICGAKNRIEKRNEIIAECLKEATELVYGVKVKNRDLMTKTERKMHDMQSMIVRAIHQANEDDDDDE